MVVFDVLYQVDLKSNFADQHYIDNAFDELNFDEINSSSHFGKFKEWDDSYI